MTNEAQDAGNYSIEQHQYNVVALGDGENPSGVMGCLRCGGDGRQMVAADGFFECQNCGALYELDDMHPTPERWAELWRHIEATRENCTTAQHADAEAAAKHAAIMARITKIVTETAPRGNVQKRRVWGLLDDMIL